MAKRHTWNTDIDMHAPAFQSSSISTLDPATVIGVRCLACDICLSHGITGSNLVLLSVDGFRT
jgi:hypothetical protein